MRPNAPENTLQAERDLSASGRGTLVVVIEDDRTMLNVIARILQGQEGFQAPVLCGSATEAIDSLRRCTPDIVLLDLKLPDLDGMSLLEMLKARRPAPKVVVLTGSNQEAEIVEAFRLGADGYLIKGGTTITQLRCQINALCHNVPVVSAGVVDTWVRLARRQEMSSTIMKSLTRREIQVLEGLAQGRSGSDIAGELGISIHTVYAHTKHIRARLKTRDLRELSREIGFSSPTPTTAAS